MLHKTEKVDDLHLTADELDTASEALLMVAESVPDGDGMAQKLVALSEKLDRIKEVLVLTGKWPCK